MPERIEKEDAAKTATGSLRNRCRARRLARPAMVADGVHRRHEAGFTAASGSARPDATASAWSEPRAGPRAAPRQAGIWRANLRGRSIAVYIGVLIGSFVVGACGGLVLRQLAATSGEASLERRAGGEAAPLPAQASAPRPEAVEPSLVERAARQIAEGRLDQPPGDNALESYREIAATSSDPAAASDVGRKLSIALWNAADRAKKGEKWDEALRYLRHLQSLPPVPLDAVAASSPTPAQSAQSQAPGADGSTLPPVTADRAAAAMPSPAASSQSDATAMQEGDELLLQGDVEAARRLYRVAASGGSAVAATAMARTYDPIFLREAGMRSTFADAGAARRWYDEGLKRGDSQAGPLLERLRSSGAASRR